MIPLHLITGLLGSGKTTLLRQLIRQKPLNEQWGILINDFGAFGIDAALVPDNQVVEISGGCLCCSAQLSLQHGLNRLLRQRPHRIFIESSGVSHPQSLALALSGLSNTRLATIIGVVTPMQLTPERWQRSEQLRTLVPLSDHLIVNKIDLATPEALNQTRHLLQGLPEPLHWQETEHGKAQLEPLLEPINRPLRLFPPSHHLTQCDLDHTPQLPGLLEAQVAQDDAVLAIGYRFKSTALFNRAQINKTLPALSITRAKGLLRTGMAWNLLQFSNGQVVWQPHGWRQDSRLIVFWPVETDKTDITRFEHHLATGITLKEP